LEGVATPCTAPSLVVPVDEPPPQPANSVVISAKPMAHFKISAIEYLVCMMISLWLLLHEMALVF